MKYYYDMVDCDCARTLENIGNLKLSCHYNTTYNAYVNVVFNNNEIKMINDNHIHKDDIGTVIEKKILENYKLLSKSDYKYTCLPFECEDKYQFFNFDRKRKHLSFLVNIDPSIEFLEWQYWIFPKYMRVKDYEVSYKPLEIGKNTDDEKKQNRNGEKWRYLRCE